MPTRLRVFYSVLTVTLFFHSRGCPVQRDKTF